MNLFISESYEAMCRQAATNLIDLVKDIPRPLICVASGDTPAGMYRELVKQIYDREIEIHNWSWVGLDEWMGMNGAIEGSCRFYVDQQLFEPLQIPGNRICFFDGKAANPDEECKRIEEFIAEHKTIDVAILGLGLNGHIGMNEPGTSKTIRSHVSELDPMTQQIGQKYFKSSQQLTQGLTLGIGTLLDSTRIMLLANGAHKAAIVKTVLEGEISERVPGSLLRLHPDLHVYLDQTAVMLVDDADLAN